MLGRAERSCYASATKGRGQLGSTDPSRSGPIPYPIYKLIHLLGLFLVFLSLGGLITHAINSGEADHPWRKGAVITHGVGMLLALLGGFGALAKLGMHWRGWVIAKIVIWVLVGALPFLLRRKPGLGKPLWIGTVVLVLAAAALAIYKPF